MRKTATVLGLMMLCGCKLNMTGETADSGAAALSASAPVSSTQPSAVVPPIPSAIPSVVPSVKKGVVDSGLAPASPPDAGPPDSGPPDAGPAVSTCDPTCVYNAACVKVSRTNAMCCEPITNGDPVQLKKCLKLHRGSGTGPD